MGSTGMHLERGRKMAEAALADLNPALTVLEHRTKRTSGEWQYVLYAAVENRIEDRVFALVVLMHRNPSPSVWFNFHYKYVDETMGPNEAECPTEILDLLTETDSEYAAAWRAECRRVAALPRPERVSVGDVVTFAVPLRFSDGHDRSSFEFVKGSVFVMPDRHGEFSNRYTRARIPHWRTIPYTVTKKAAA